MTGEPDQIPRLEGTTTLVSRFQIPLSPDHPVDDEEARRLAWLGFQELVAYTNDPPTDFTVEIRRIEE
jgi:hypothetical protein